MTKIKQIVRTDLLSKLEFSQKFKISRVKLDELIRANMLPTEEIAGIKYISVKDRAIIDAALRYKTVRSGTYTRKHDFKMPIIKSSDQDYEFEMAWRKSQGIK